MRPFFKLNCTTSAKTLLVAGCCFFLLFLWLFLSLPLPSKFPVPCSAQVVDRHGRLLRLFATADGRWRLPIQLDGRGGGSAVDPEFVRLLLACEDKRFWSHHGVDPLALARAFVQFVRHGRVVSGASTITMQTVRLLQPRPRTIWSKLLEMAQALRLERRLGKREILETYLTLAPYGGNIEGLEAACRFYFGKNAARIMPSEAALLISLPQAPERRRPDRQPQQAQAARNRILRRLARAGLLSAEQAKLALVGPIPRQRQPTPFLAPHLSWRLHAARPGEELIRTSLDGRLQEQMEAVAAQAQEQIGEDGQRTLALLVLDSRTRQVLAHVGSGSWHLSRIDLTRAWRSPGSTLKPFVYGLAFELGVLHPETQILDRPDRFGSYGPENFDRTHHGWVSAREALHRSLNLPAVQVLERIGPERLLSRLAGLGVAMASSGDPGLSLALGGAATRLEDLAALYAALANQGMHRPISFAPDAVAGVEKRLFSPAAAWQVDDILRGMPLTAGPSGRGSIRCKTGTSYGFRDAWAIGYTRQHVVGVWIGRPDGGYGKWATGSNAAAPILLQAFAVLSSVQGEQRMAGVEYRERPPAGVLTVRNSSELPSALQWFGRSSGQASQHGGPKIYFPVDGSVLQLGMDPVLVLKSHGGVPPFHWLVNGRPLGREHQDATASCVAPEDGLSEITLLDSQGRRDSVSVWVEREKGMDGSKLSSLAQ